VLQAPDRVHIFKRAGAMLELFHATHERAEQVGGRARRRSLFDYRHVITCRELRR
jgi:hypothetical protein